ncbi:MAG: hypothetical protein LBC40_05920 [Dysgonamonadaceae bacterium]|jgi:hypothetical protein|nr:hypothetical protein [Dysgonamonadaceae bacterium]
MKNFLKITILIAAVPAIGLLLSLDATGSNMGVQCATLGFLPLLSLCGEDNMGGMQNRMAFIPLCDVSSVPVLSANPDSEAEMITAIGSWVFKTAKGKPLYIYATDKTVKYSSENQGETDGQSFKQSGEFFHPGARIGAAAFARKVNNTPGYLVLVSTEGNQFMVGQPGLPCSIKPSFDAGQARTDRRGFKFTFEADSYCPFILLADASKIDFDEIMEEAPEEPGGEG